MTPHGSSERLRSPLDKWWEVSVPSVFRRLWLSLD
jgi:hypothetical protein